MNQNPSIIQSQSTESTISLSDEELLRVANGWYLYVSISYVYSIPYRLNSKSMDFVDYYFEAIKDRKTNEELEQLLSLRDLSHLRDGIITQINNGGKEYIELRLLVSKLSKTIIPELKEILEEDIPF